MKEESTAEGLAMRVAESVAKRSILDYPKVFLRVIVAVEEIVMRW